MYVGVRLLRVVQKSLEIAVKLLTEYVSLFTIEDFPSTQRTHVITGTHKNK